MRPHVSPSRLAQAVERKRRYECSLRTVAKSTAVVFSFEVFNLIALYLTFTMDPEIVVGIDFGMTVSDTTNIVLPEATTECAAVYRGRLFNGARLGGTHDDSTLARTAESKPQQGRYHDCISPHARASCSLGFSD